MLTLLQGSGTIDASCLTKPQEEPGDLAGRWNFYDCHWSEGRCAAYFSCPTIKDLRELVASPPVLLAYCARGMQHTKLQPTVILRAIAARIESGDAAIPLGVEAELIVDEEKKKPRNVQQTADIVIWMVQALRRAQVDSHFSQIQDARVAIDAVTESLGKNSLATVATKVSTFELGPLRDRGESDFEAYNRAINLLRHLKSRLNFKRNWKAYETPNGFDKRTRVDNRSKPYWMRKKIDSAELNPPQNQHPLDEDGDLLKALDAIAAQDFEYRKIDPMLLDPIPVEIERRPTQTKPEPDLLVERVVQRQPLCFDLDLERVMFKIEPDEVKDKADVSTDKNLSLSSQGLRISKSSLDPTHNTAPTEAPTFTRYHIRLSNRVLNRTNTSHNFFPSKKWEETWQACFYSDIPFPTFRERITDHFKLPEQGLQISTIYLHSQTATKSSLPVTVWPHTPYAPSWEMVQAALKNRPGVYWFTLEVSHNEDGEGRSDGMGLAPTREENTQGDDDDDNAWEDIEEDEI
jgi:hypothetical protein